MIKDKLHTISDEDAIEVGKILLKTSTSFLYDFYFEKIIRINYYHDRNYGTDDEESVNVYFNAVVKHESYRASGWENEKIMIKLIESDRYHENPYFISSSQRESEQWKYHFLSNHIEAIEFLQKKGLL